MKLILLGAPGAGKGTQSDILQKKLDVPVISTGNILRAEMEHGTDLGRQIRQYMDEGVLVPDEIILEMMKHRLSEPDCINGFILDGVPRTIAQAEALERSGMMDGIHVLAMEVEDKEIETRMAGRRVCIECGASYHIASKPPKTSGVCDRCGGEVILRPDDEPETVRRRLRIYHQTTEPLKEFYRKRGVLVTIHTRPTIEETTRLIAEALGL